MSGLIVIIVVIFLIVISEPVIVLFYYIFHKDNNKIKILPTKPKNPISFLEYFDSYQRREHIKHCRLYNCDKCNFFSKEEIKLYGE